ncbi:MAG: DUF2851 family protein, partial [Calditrichales bacterium]
MDSYIDSEQVLYTIWEMFCRLKQSTPDQRLSGYEAGRLNTFEGPDYRNAEFELDGKVYRGDVEIHLKTNDWYRHNHHLDRRYDSVLLHLVWKDNAETVVYNSERRPVITIDMRNFPKLLPGIGPRCTCPTATDVSLPDEPILQQLSLYRLHHKIADIKNRLTNLPIEQVLYSLLLKQLGNPRNTKNFELFAAQYTWDDIIRLKKLRVYTLHYWQKLFLEMGGLREVRDLVYRSDGPTQSSLYPAGFGYVSKPDWYLSGQRPENHPAVHLKRLGTWVFHLEGNSIYYPLKQTLMHRLPYAKLLKNVYTFFSPPLSLPDLPASKQMPVWGKSKCNELIGNVIIPFFIWEANAGLNAGFREYLEGFYYWLPSGGPYTCLRRFDLWFAGA